MTKENNRQINVKGITKTATIPIQTDEQEVEGKKGLQPVYTKFMFTFSRSEIINWTHAQTNLKGEDLSDYCRNLLIESIKKDQNEQFLGIINDTDNITLCDNISGAILGFLRQNKTTFQMPTIS